MSTLTTSQTTSYQAIADYNYLLVRTAIRTARRQCMASGQHFLKVNRSACAYCGGDK